MHPAGRGGMRSPGRGGLLGWFSRHRVAIALAVALFFIACTGYVVWAVQDLPDPNVDFLAAGDIVFLDHNGQVVKAHVSTKSQTDKPATQMWIVEGHSPYDGRYITDVEFVKD
jgi:hypothetical protein